MVGAAALEVRSGLAFHLSAVAEQHGFEHGGVFKRPQATHSCSKAAAEPVTPKFQPRAGEPGQQLDAVHFYGGERDNTLLIEVAAVIECSCISEVVRQTQLGGKAQPLAVVESRERLVGGIIFI